MQRNTESKYSKMQRNPRQVKKVIVNDKLPSKVSKKVRVKENILNVIKIEKTLVDGSGNSYKMTIEKV